MCNKSEELNLNQPKIRNIQLNIVVPEYSWVNVATLYRTPIGEFQTIDAVEEVGRLIAYLQRSKETQAIIKMSSHFRKMICSELIRKYLRLIDEKNIDWYGEALSGFLADFDKKMTGLSFEDYEFKYSILSNGSKIQFKTFSKLFNNEEDAMAHITSIFIQSQDFKYTVKESIPG